MAIDLANIIVRLRKLGVPQESRDSFRLLVQGELLNLDLGQRLESMVGFRNVAVHRYREIDPAIAETVITVHLDDLLTLAKIVLELSGHK